MGRKRMKIQWFESAKKGNVRPTRTWECVYTNIGHGSTATPHEIGCPLKELLVEWRIARQGPVQLGQQPLEEFREVLDISDFFFYISRRDQQPVERCSRTNQKTAETG